MGDTAPVVVRDVGVTGVERWADHLQTPSPVRVLIADDAPDARFLLRVWLERHGAMDVVAEATDGVEAVECARQVHPDLVVLDVSMPRMDGLEAAAEIRRALPEARIILFSAFSADRMGARAVLAGADVYLEKKCGPEEIFAAIDALFGVQPIGPVSPNPAAVPVEPDPHETRWRVLLDALDEGVVVVDHAARIGATNHAATTLLGIPTSGMVGRSLTDLFVDATNAEGRRFDADGPDPVTATLRTGRPRSGVVVGVRRPDGERGWLCVNVRPIDDASGPSGARGAIASMSDVTGVHALRSELAAASARTQGVLDASASSVLVVSAVRDEHGGVDHHRVGWGNRTALAGTGWAVGTALRAPAARRSDGEEAGLVERVADALDRDADATARRSDVRWSRSGDDEIVLTWDPRVDSGS